MTTPDVRCTCTGTCHPEVCDHGFWLADCALCHKHVGECDYGSCVEPATTRVETLSARGTVVERRPMCAVHARVLAATDHIGRGTRDV